MTTGVSNELRDALRGVVVERGTLLACRDAACYEMVVKMNSVRYGNHLIGAVLTGGNNEMSTEQNSSIGTSEGGGLLFVRDIPGVEEEVQSWLDPFSNRARSQLAASGRQGANRPLSGGEDDDSEVDDDFDDVESDSEQ